LAASPDEDQATAELRPSHQGRPAPGATKASIRQRPRTRNQRINPLTRALSLNPWMGDFVWSLTRFPERRPGVGTVAHA